MTYKFAEKPETARLDENRIRELLSKQRQDSRVISPEVIEGSVGNGVILAGTCCGSRTSNDCHSD